ncbi:hypothetical protein PCASD_16732 [Puccinia coronata f. sp. avenae]|uniref:Uncharacterized protein n=1 Tax=Puccinia coronata f. sp. avenae TaxID=200324 RepID=A0A2N5TX81_9BASI|nr:hypothetical protein PCASD_16732 [Puccinia coronata f. sp. avenae]
MTARGEHGPMPLGRELMHHLDFRLESISPAFRYREQLLRLRRATFQLRSRGAPAVVSYGFKRQRSQGKRGTYKPHIVLFSRLQNYRLPPLSSNKRS